MGGHSSFYLAGAMAKTAFPRSPCSICGTPSLCRCSSQSFQQLLRHKVTKVLWTPVWPRPVFDAHGLNRSCQSAVDLHTEAQEVKPASLHLHGADKPSKPSFLRSGTKCQRSPADIYKVSRLCSQSGTACKCTDSISSKYICRQQDFLLLFAP